MKLGSTSMKENVKHANADNAVPVSGSVGSHNFAEDNNDSNEELMRQMHLGENSQEAFNQLVEQNINLFYGFAYRLLGNKQDAEDVLQICFMRVWHSPELWDADFGASFKTWFTRVVLNECRMVLRKDKRNAAKPSSYEDPSDNSYQAVDHGAISNGHDQSSAEKELDLAQRRQIVKDVIEQLPDRQKEALILCYYEGTPQREAAEIMDVSLKALESLLSRAKKQIKDMLHDTIHI